MATATQVNRIVSKHVLWSMGAGAIPVPILDFAAVTTVQLGMLKDLCEAYEVDFSESLGKSMITALAGGSLARIGASAVKALPGIGSLIGGVSMVVLSGAATYATGHVFARHLESGGDLFDFDFGWGKEAYQEEFEKGKAFAKDVERKKKEKQQQAKSGGAAKGKKSKEDVFAELDKLGELRDKGILTEEEFKEQKERLLAQL